MMSPKSLNWTKWDGTHMSAKGINGAFTIIQASDTPFMLTDRSTEERTDHKTLEDAKRKARRLHESTLEVFIHKWYHDEDTD